MDSGVKTKYPGVETNHRLVESGVIDFLPNTNISYLVYLVVFGFGYIAYLVVFILTTDYRVTRIKNTLKPKR